MIHLPPEYHFERQEWCRVGFSLGTIEAYCEVICVKTIGEIELILTNVYSHIMTGKLLRLPVLMKDLNSVAIEYSYDEDKFCVKELE